MVVSVARMAQSVADGGDRSIHVLVVDDEIEIRTSLEKCLSDEGFVVSTAANGEETLRAIRGLKLDVVLLDQGLPGRSGVEILQEIQAGSNAPRVVMITGLPELEGAVTAMRLGAYDYVGKPLNLAKLSRTIRNAAEGRRLEQENTILRHMVGKQPFVGPIVCESPKFLEVVDLAKRVAKASAPVLIVGATGTGK
jgi:DNA-binding NtrC family response regulator